ncbi:cytochrome P450 [Streptomyces sp. JJ36]|uniref:cytochrome P450 n=1 Tax=Streptomyces sp. JJ36 TaxID=2736645 RepID=UPI001F43D7C9|nr:cytochrome P450 [Streptomyces sp. JJ36]MCF6524534.1 cytochrome P450 [Streptomyces sp. JJ36]
MTQRHRSFADRTAALAAAGYTWLPGLLRRAGTDSVLTRVLGRPTVGLHGPDAVRFFYDESHVRRRDAAPDRVKSTLFGHGGVQGLDGREHRVRRELFLSLLTPADAVADLVTRTEAAWDEAVHRWARRERIVLFDEVSRVLTRGVCDWAGVPVEQDDEVALARDLVAMVDGFAAAGPRHRRARRARARREEWLSRLVADLRAGRAFAPGRGAAEAVALHRDADGERLPPRVAAVELLNVLRPTVAVAWFAAFSAHALHHRPEVADRLRASARSEDVADRSGYVHAFAQEVRRFYPFAPFTGGRAVDDLDWHGLRVPRDALILLDLYGQDHDPRLWTEPYAFAPQRFLARPFGGEALVPQGGGDMQTGHRCPGEPATVALLRALAARLARLQYRVPRQDMRISLRRMPARPRSGMVLAGVRPGDA